VGLYVPLLEFNPQERGLVEVQLRYAPQSTPYAPDIGLAFNALAPPTERLAADYVPAASKIYLIRVS
jgi:hypothetical protein